MSNIEPLARAITERICVESENANPSDPQMTAAQIAAWVDTHWQCAAAELEAGILNDDGSRVPNADWRPGLVAYNERMCSTKP